MQGSNCCFLTSIQVSQETGRWSGISISLRVFYNFYDAHSQGFSIVNETEVDVFLEFSCFLYDPENVGNLISGSSAFFKPSSNIRSSLVHIMLQPSLEDFGYNLTNLRNECNCPVVWTFFSTALLGNWDEDWPFPVLWPLLGFPNFLTYLIAPSFRILNSSAGIPSPPLALLAAVLPKAHWLHTPQCLAEWVCTIMVIWVIKIFLAWFFCVVFPSFDLSCFY